MIWYSLSSKILTLDLKSYDTPKQKSERGKFNQIQSSPEQNTSRIPESPSELSRRSGNIITPLTSDKTIGSVAGINDPGHSSDDVKSRKRDLSMTEIEEEEGNDEEGNDKDDKKKKTSKAKPTTRSSKGRSVSARRSVIEAIAEEEGQEE